MLVPHLVAVSVNRIGMANDTKLQACKLLRCNSPRGVSVAPTIIAWMPERRDPDKPLHTFIMRFRASNSCGTL